MFFGRKEKLELSEEILRKMRQSEVLLAQTRSRMKRGDAGHNMTCSLQLKNDCDSLERMLGALKKGKIGRNGAADLENLYLRLKTTSENIMNWSFNEEDI